MTVVPDDSTDTEHYPLYTLQSSTSTPPITVPVLLEWRSVDMELDTGWPFL